MTQQIREASEAGCPCQRWMDTVQATLTHIVIVDGVRFSSRSDHSKIEGITIKLPMDLFNFNNELRRKGTLMMQSSSHHTVFSTHKTQRCHMNALRA